VPVDERVEVHGVEIRFSRVGQPGDVARSDRLPDPLDEGAAFLQRSRLAALTRDLSQTV
jgi:hypothetical protein